MLYHPVKSYWLTESSDIELLDIASSEHFLSSVPVALKETSIRALKDVLYWARGFLANPHSQLGRTGNVCPFVKGSLGKNLFWLTVQEEVPDTEKLHHLMGEMLEWFVELEPISTEESVYKTVLVLLPDLRGDDVASLLNSTQRDLKHQFVKLGFMIGQFYQDCEEHGIRNKLFRPLRAPVPLLAIRRMVPTDILFLDSDREHWRAYQKLFTRNDLPGTFQEVFDVAEKRFS